MTRHGAISAPWPTSNRTYTPTDTAQAATEAARWRQEASAAVEHASREVSAAVQDCAANAENWRREAAAEARELAEAQARIEASDRDSRER